MEERLEGEVRVAMAEQLFEVRAEGDLPEVGEQQRAAKKAAQLKKEANKVAKKCRFHAAMAGGMKANVPGCRLWTTAHAVPRANKGKPLACARRAAYGCVGVTRTVGDQVTMQKCCGGSTCPVYVAAVDTHGEGSPEFIHAMLFRGGFHPRSKFCGYNQFVDEGVPAGFELPQSSYLPKKYQASCPLKASCPLYGKVGCRGGRACVRLRTPEHWEMLGGKVPRDYGVAMRAALNAV